MSSEVVIEGKTSCLLRQQSTQLYSQRCIDIFNQFFCYCFCLQQATSSKPSSTITTNSQCCSCCELTTAHWISRPLKLRFRRSQLRLFFRWLTDWLTDRATDWPTDNTTVQTSPALLYSSRRRVIYLIGGAVSDVHGQRHDSDGNLLHFTVLLTDWLTDWLSCSLTDSDSLFDCSRAHLFS